MKSPNLLAHKPKVLCLELSGLAFIKNSVGRTDNLKLSTYCTIDNTTGNVSVSNAVYGFEGMVDAFRFEFSNYNDAVDKYNELAIKWNGYRES